MVARGRQDSKEAEGNGWKPVKRVAARRRWAVAGTAVRSVLRFDRAGRERRSRAPSLSTVPEGSVTSAEAP
jgi:hypothetical protein